MIQCANPSQPQGGEKDEDGPTLRENKPVDPPDQSLNIRPKEITFNFEEYLKPGNYRNEVFIAPIPEKPPEVLVAGKSLKVKFKGDLLDSTTYVVTIGEGIVDYTEGNKMDKPIVYAFSTGDYLDSLKLRGSVLDPVVGRGLGDYTVMLFEKDSVPDNNIFGKKPKYITNTTKRGTFKFFYLADGDYKIFAVKDEDHSHSYNSQKEFIGYTEDPKVVFTDSGFGDVIILYAFQPDEQPPAPKGAKWINEKTVMVDFKEKLNMKVGQDSLQVFVSDTAETELKECLFIQEVFYLPGRGGQKGKYLIYSPLARHNPIKISFKNLMDTLGNSIDTFINVMPTSFDKDFVGTAFLQPEIRAEKGIVRINSTLPLKHNQSDSLLKNILLDSAGRGLNVTAKVIDYGIEIRLNEPPARPTKTKLLLHQDFRWWDGSYSDSNYTFDLVLPGFENTGSITGTVDDTLDRGNWIVRLVDEAGKVVGEDNSESFHFPLVKEGKYQFMLIKDEDGNGYWTPGSSSPYKLPETVYLETKTVEVKAKWAIEDITIIPKPLGYVDPAATNRADLD